MALNWTLIDRLAQAHRLIDPTTSEKDLFRALKLWWCLKYNRPFKDPLIESYSLDELVYEYLVHHYLDPENDPQKKKQKEKEAESEEEWIKKQLAQVAAGVKPVIPKPSIPALAAQPGFVDTAKEAPAPEVAAPPDISTTFEE